MNDPASARFYITQVSRALVGQPMLKATTNEPEAAYDLAKHLIDGGGTGVQIRDSQTQKFYTLESFSREFGVTDA